MDRIWGVVSEPDSFFTNDVIINLFSTFLAPFGQYHPYSCMPTALVEIIGHPPPDWEFIEHVVKKLVIKWNTKSRKRWREEPLPPPVERKVRKALPPVLPKAMPKAKPPDRPGPQPPPGRQPPSRIGPRGSIARSMSCMAGKQHPDCKAEGCIGSPLSRLVTHLERGKYGETYCEPCWCSFVRRNPALEGVFADKVRADTQG